jgi:hypothetical protein
MEKAESRKSRLEGLKNVRERKATQSHVTRKGLRRGNMGNGWHGAGSSFRSFWTNFTSDTLT